MSSPEFFPAHPGAADLDKLAAQFTGMVCYVGLLAWRRFPKLLLLIAMFNRFVITPRLNGAATKSRVLGQLSARILLEQMLGAAILWTSAQWAS